MIDCARQRNKPNSIISRTTWLWTGIKQRDGRGATAGSRIIQDPCCASFMHTCWRHELTSRCVHWTDVPTRLIHSNAGNIGGYSSCPFVSVRLPSLLIGSVSCKTLLKWYSQWLGSIGACHTRAMIDNAMGKPRGLSRRTTLFELSSDR